MKKEKIIFWITTAIFSVSMLASANMYLTDAGVKAGFASHLGIPDYLRIELAIAKILGSLALLLPFVPKVFKNFAYAGFTINLISAFVAHVALGDIISDTIKPVIFFAILTGSYMYYNKLEEGKYRQPKNNNV
jgi:putative oxidoreductase